MLIYKILRAAEWHRFSCDGATPGAPVDVADGFIHFSTAQQVRETAAKHFAGEADLVLLAIETDKLTDLRWEPARGGDLFPHLYGELDIRDVIWYVRLPLTDDGHEFPEGLA